MSNIVVNRWQRDDKSEESYELLTMSPTGIERLDRKAHGKDPFEGKLVPQDIKLSDAMATSAAALSTHMGKYDNSVEGLNSSSHNPWTRNGRYNDQRHPLSTKGKSSKEGMIP